MQTNMVCFRVRVSHKCSKLNVHCIATDHQSGHFTKPRIFKLSYNTSQRFGINQYHFKQFGDVSGYFISSLLVCVCVVRCSE